MSIEFRPVTETLPEPEADIDALEFGLDVEPVAIPVLPEEANDDPEEVVKRREEVKRLMQEQARRRANYRGKSTVSIKNGRRGRVIGTWMSEETLDTLGELSIAWEMSRTKVLTQLVRQAKGSKIKQYYAPAPGEIEVPDRMTAPEWQVKLHQRKV
jgi:hypothetical protein